MHLHLLGIGGTFMTGIATIAKELGHQVSGSDQNIYPPMSDELAKHNIKIFEGYDPGQIKIKPDIFIIGNSISRGNPLFEKILDQNLNYISAPQWLSENVLRFRKVIAVAGTHGKTTVSSMITHILTSYALENNKPLPGYLIGGVAKNLPNTASLGRNYFVIEADEYDTALFDKRSKFIHYRPKYLILNNLEFDHADIFKNIQAIETSFHHLVRTLPRSADIIANLASTSIKKVINRGCYSNLHWFNHQDYWYIKKSNSQYFIGKSKQRNPDYLIPENIIGKHNRENLLPVLIVANLFEEKISIKQSLQYIEEFKGVKRRQELKYQIHGIKIYDDFAHHPSSIKATINSLKENLTGRIIAVFEPSSNSMKMGVFKDQLNHAFENADYVFSYNKNLLWNIDQYIKGANRSSFDNFENIAQAISKIAKDGDVIIRMSNGNPSDFFEKLVTTFKKVPK